MINLIINLDTYKTLKYKAYLTIKQSDYMYKWVSSEIPRACLHIVLII